MPKRKPLDIMANPIFKKFFLEEGDIPKIYLNCH
jgi:hypothetical protein